MSVEFLPSLQMMSCVQIAIPILNYPRIKQLINCYDVCSGDVELCSLIEKMMMEKIQLLVSPLLHKMVRNYAMSMFFHLVECKNIFSSILTDFIIYVDQDYKYIWKCDGTIDQRMSAKVLITNKNFHIKERFILACNYCFIDEAHCLWNFMQATGKSFTPSELDSNLVLKLWSRTFQEGSVNMRITHQVIESYALQHNVYLLGYVFKRIPQELQPYLLLHVALRRKYIDAPVMHFCLSRLNMSDKESVFQQSPLKVLQCFVTWPYQCVFLHMADCLWTYLSKQDYCEILWSILNKIMDQDWSDFSLLELLEEFWSRSPTEFKECTKHQTVFGPLMVALNCDMQYFPRNELDQASEQSLEQYLNQLILARRNTRYLAA